MCRRAVLVWFACRFTTTCALLPRQLAARVASRSDAIRHRKACRRSASPQHADEACHTTQSRRAAIGRLAASCTAAAAIQPAAAAESLRDALAARDANRLTKPFYSIPPGPTTFPDWLEGRWRCSATFQGFQFPNEKISKQRVVAETDLPGFTKLSIARFGDVGREKTDFELNFVKRGGKVIEDYGNNVASALAAHVDKPDLVKNVAWDAANPNRMTMSLVEGGRNGERIEIFVNSRRSEALDGDIFLNSESIRQMTLGRPRPASFYPFTPSTRLVTPLRSTDAAEPDDAARGHRRVPALLDLAKRR